jgi:hypothetical protein
MSVHVLAIAPLARKHFQLPAMHVERLDNIVKFDRLGAMFAAFDVLPLVFFRTGRNPFQVRSRALRRSSL